MEQLKQSSNQELVETLQYSNLPPKILCRVVHIRLLVEHDTEEVYAEIILLPSQDQNEPTAPDFTSLDTPRPPTFQSFRKFLTPSDIKSNWGLYVPQKDAVKCFPPLDMMEEKPSQELIATDLQGNEWHFKHVYQGGQPRRHLLTNGWSTFVTSKKLLSGDLVVFLRDETGKLHVGIRRLSCQRSSVGSSTFLRQSMEGVIAVASHAFATRNLFFVYYKPCYNKSSQFITSLRKYFEGGNQGIGLSHLRRTTDMDQMALSQCQQTTNLVLEEDQYMQDSEAISNITQPSLMVLEIRQQTVESLNKGSVPIQAPVGDIDELFNDIDFPGFTNTSLDTIPLDSDSDWFRSIIQDQEDASPSSRAAFGDPVTSTSSISENPTSSSISSTPSHIRYDGPGRGDEQITWAGYQVARRCIPTLNRVVSRYPDLLVNFKVTSSIFQSMCLEILAELVYFLDKYTIGNLTKDQIIIARQHLFDLKLSGIGIGWLENRLLHIDEVSNMESLLQRRQALTLRMEENLATFRQLDKEFGCINKELHELSLKVGPNPPMTFHPVLEGLL